MRFETRDLRLPRDSEVQSRVQPHAQDRAGRKLHIFALGRCDGATAADEDARERALQPSQDAADDRADAGAGADTAGLSPDAFTLRLGKKKATASAMASAVQSS